MALPTHPFNMFGSGSSPYDMASPHLGDAKSMFYEMYNPYREIGMRQMETLEDQYARLVNDPGAQWALLSSGYQQSPGYQWQMDEAMRAADTAAAAGGTAGTTSHQQQSMQLAQDLANQDYYNYMNQIMGLYGTGLSGTQGLFDTGYDATSQLARSLGSVYGAEAKLAFAAQAAEDAQNASLWGSTVGAIF